MIAHSDDPLHQPDDATSRCVLTRSKRHSRIDDDRPRGITAVGKPGRHDRKTVENLFVNTLLPLLRPVDLNQRLSGNLSVVARRERRAHERVGVCL